MQNSSGKVVARGIDKPSRVIKKGILPRSLEQLYQSYAFQNADTGYAFAYDTIDEWKVGTDRTLELLTSRFKTVADDDLVMQEREFLEKMCVNWRLRGYGTVYPHSAAELSCMNAEQAAQLGPEFRRRRIYYEAMLRQLGTDVVTKIATQAPIVLDSGKGSPLWVPGTDPAGGIALHKMASRASDGPSLKLIATQLAGRKPSLVQTSYIRIQAARGEQLGWTLGAPDMVLKPMMVTGRPKVRRIAAQPFIINHLWAPYAEVLRHIMAMTPDGLHAGKIEPLLERASTWQTLAAFDLKSYDTTVSYETHVALRTHLWLPIVQRIYQMVPTEVRRALISPEMLSEIDEVIITMPILAPPADQNSAATIWSATGQIRSGENPTSWKGTEIRRAQGRCKARHLGYEERDLLIYNYGDDTLIMSNDPRIKERWMSVPSFVGLNEEAAPDSSFLMRRIPAGYSYLGRMVAASINREMSHEPSSSLSAAAAFCTRFFLLQGHPLQDAFFPALKAYGGPDRMRTAVSVAEAAAESGLDACLQLNLLASYTKQIVNHKDYGDITSALRQLIDRDESFGGLRTNIEQVIHLIEERKRHASHTLSWQGLVEASDLMSDSSALAALKEYRVERRIHR